VTEIVHRGRWTRGDRAAGEYRYLPVSVPAGSAGLTVTLRYDRSAGVLDLGCLDPTGFRGWSGGARDNFAIGAAAATPGYLPGPLPAGEWQVVLGLYRIGPDGVPWEVTATADRRPPDLPAIPAPAGAPSTPDRPRRELPASPGLRWLAGDLHAHTVHSDGALSVAELAALAYRRGLDFLAVTDHNTVSHHAELPAAAAATGMILLPGQEVTTGTGHANAFGDIGWIDFRAPADEWLAETERRGGLLSVNHPLAADLCWRQPLRRPAPLAEIWHWSWLDRHWGGPLAWWQAAGGAAIPVGGSDFHRPGDAAPPGSPTTWVGCDAAQVDGGDPTGAVLAGLRAGRTAVSAGYGEPVLLRVAGELVAVRADGLLLADTEGRRVPVRGDRVRLPDRAGPCWLEDHDTAVVAITG
jgi:hypothetical protein